MINYKIYYNIKIIMITKLMMYLKLNKNNKLIKIKI